MAELRILGPLELRGPTGNARLGGDKPRRLLGALALHAGEVVPVDRLIDLAWGDSPPRSARANLLTYLSSLRRALRPYAGLSIEARPPGYRLLGDSESLDWMRFLELADAAREVYPGDPGKAGLLLREALGLWRGPVLADVADGLTALQPRIAALAEARLSAQVLCLDADLLTGRHAEVLGELAELTRDHPLHEQLRGQHMLALYRCGRQAEALALFHQLREHLADELGVDPGPDLSRLYEAILRADPQLTQAPAVGVLDASVLIVLDSAAGRAQVRPLLPGSPGCLVLITGRSQLRGLAIREGAASVPLGPLAEPEAVTLLRRLLPGPRVDAEAGTSARSGCPPGSDWRR